MRTPTQFRAARQSKAVELEKRIDRAIDNAAVFGDTMVTIGLAGVDHDVAESVVVDYRRAGWKAEVVADPRDGDFIKLELP